MRFRAETTMRARRVGASMLVGACVALLSACGHAPPRAQAEPPAEPSVPSTSLVRQLERDVGQGRSVAIVPGRAGLLAISSDGARQVTLLAEPVPWALVDARSNVVWLGTSDGTGISAIDLEDPAVKVEPVAAGIPPYEGFRGEASFDVVYPQDQPGLDEAGRVDHGLVLELTPNRQVAHVELHLGPTPRIVGELGFFDEAEEHAEWVSGIERVALPGQAFLRKISARPSRLARVPARPATRRLEVDTERCEDAAECGEAEVVVGTRWWRVIVAGACGDGCHRDWQLYDAEAGRFAEGEHAYLKQAYVAPDGSAFVTSGRVVRFEGGPLAATLDESTCGQGGGWLGGGTFYGL